MEAILREGALRLLASETSCDVILSCQGQKLTGHKIMLSIASPILHDLLIEEKAEIAVIILPDISGRTMSHLLDYIYNGSVLVPSQCMDDFLIAANLLKVHIDFESTATAKLNAEFGPFAHHRSFGGSGSKAYGEYNGIGTLKDDFLKPPDPKREFYKTPPPNPFTPPHCSQSGDCGAGGADVDEHKVASSSSALPPLASPVNLVDAPPAVAIPAKKKTLRKVPNLMPISRYASVGFRLPKSNYNRPAPSPWCPRMIPLITDPREECMNATTGSTSSPSPEYHHEKNDSNNNFQFSDPLSNAVAPYYARRPTRSNSPQNMCLNKGPLYPAAASYAARSLTPPHTTGSCISLSKSNSFTNENASLGFPLTETAACLDYATKSSPRSLVPQPRPLSGHGLPFSPPQSLSSLQHLVNPLGPASVAGIVEVPCAETVEARLRPSCSSAPGSSSGDDAPDDGLAAMGLLPDDGLIDEESKDDDGKGDEKLKPYKCDDCGKTFSQLRNFKYHRSVHEGTREFAARCPECGKLFQDRGYLSSHMKIHRDRKEYACPSCPKRFNQRVAYNMHLRIHTGVKPHECTTCGKSFSRKMLLKQHQRVHTGERPYKCPQCGKSFADRSNMSLHARLHTGVKPYACSLCPKSFTKKHHLKTHMNYHTGLKPYSCEHCGLAFSQSSNMRTHYKKCVLKPPPQTT